MTISVGDVEGTWTPLGRSVDLAASPQPCMAVSTLRDRVGGLGGGAVVVRQMPGSSSWDDVTK
jgi:hypothetical protein